ATPLPLRRSRRAGGSTSPARGATPPRRRHPPRRECDRCPARRPITPSSRHPRKSVRRSLSASPQSLIPKRMARVRCLLLLILVLQLAVAAAPGATYDESRSAALGRCDAIDPAASQSGLIFNPAGYRSFYLRSECLQTTAVQFRDEALCSRVKQRRSLFFSS